MPVVQCCHGGSIWRSNLPCIIESTHYWIYEFFGMRGKCKALTHWWHFSHHDHWIQKNVTQLESHSLPAWRATENCTPRSPVTLYHGENEMSNKELSQQILVGANASHRTPLLFWCLILKNDEVTSRWLRAVGIQRNTQITHHRHHTWIHMTLAPMSPQ